MSNLDLDEFLGRKSLDVNINEPGMGLAQVNSIGNRDPFLSR
jgi:hypothetical protein